MTQQPQPHNERTTQYKGPWWKHPYFVYMGLTVVLFGLLMFVGWLAWINDWIPQRGSI